MSIAIFTKEKKNWNDQRKAFSFDDKHTSTKGIESSISRKHYNMYHDHNVLKHFAIWLVVIFYVHKL